MPRLRRIRLFPEVRRVPWRAVAARVYREIVKDAVPDISAQLAYYFLFSLFPFLIVLVAIAAYLPLEDAAHTLFHRLEPVMPEQAMEILHAQIHSLLGETRPNVITVGILVTLWTASRGVDALRKGLNLAYDVRETRPFWLTQVVAIGVTAGTAIVMLGSFAIVVLGGRFGRWLAEKGQLEAQFATLWSWLRWPVTVVALLVMTTLMYALLPDVKQRFRFVTPGALAATAAGLGLTWGFTEVADRFGRWNAAYGSIAGVVLLLMWLYLIGFIVLVGGELNAAVEHLSPEGKASGAREEGEPPPPDEERPSAAPPGAVSRADLPPE